MPLLFRVFLLVCVSSAWTIGSDFPVVQLIRSDVQDLYNPETRYGMRYGSVLNADAGGSGQESERGSGAIPPAPGGNGYKSLLASSNASYSDVRSQNATVNATAGSPPNLNQPKFPTESATRPLSITEIATTAILNGWTPESQQATNVASSVAPFPRYASLQIGAVQSQSPFISSFGRPPTSTVLDAIATAVLNPLQTGPIERPYPLQTITATPTHTPTSTPLVTVTTPSGDTYTLGTSPTVTVIAQTNTTTPNNPPIILDPHLGEAATPEPSSMILAVSGLLAGIAVARRRS